MSHPQPSSPRVLSPASGDFVKDVANSNVKEEPEAAPARAPGSTEPPLPLTPERLELIKAYAASRSRGADEVGASRIAKRFAPRGSAELRSTQTKPAAPAPVTPPAETGPAAPAPVTPPARTGPAAPAPATPPLLAWASGIRRLTAVLVIAALLPNIALAIYWFRLLDTPSSEATLPPKNSAQLRPEPEILSPVLSIPDTLEASAGMTIAVPIALDGTDAVPEGSVLVIKGLPPGSTLSGGHASGEAEWKLTPGEIGDLQLRLGDAASGDSRLIVELVAPGNGTIATASTTLRTKAAVKIEPFPYGISQGGTEQAPIPDQAPVPDQALVQDIEATEPGAGAQENAPLETASVEGVSLPDRRPEPPADANWIRPTAWVNLRDGPSSTAKVLKIVPKGVKLRVLARKRGWIQVEEPKASQSGWIYAGNVASVR